MQDADNVVNLVEEQQITSENKQSRNLNPKNKLSFEQAREKLKSEVKWGDCDLTREQQDRLLDVLVNNIQAFSLNGELGDCDLIEHEIKLEDNARPINKKPYRYSPTAIDQGKKHIEELKKQGVIEECVSPWNSNVVIVNKPRKSPSDPIQTRFCVDYRHVNNITAPDRNYWPRLDSTIDRIGMAEPKFFSTVDLISGFFQQRLNPESRPITVFSFEGLQYQFSKLPMGLKNSPSSNTRLMNRILQNLAYKKAMCYVDDVCIYSKTFDEHLIHLDLVLKRLIQANLKLKLEKCCFARKKIRFLGNILSAEGCQPDPEKTRVIREYTVPSTRKELKRWLGMVGFYRKFIPLFSRISEPLTKLLSKKVDYVWSEACESSFQTLKKSLLQEPILGYPDFKRPFRIYTDGSLEGISAMLTQVQEHNGEEIERVLWYAGRALNKHEKNYNITNLELTAIYYAVQQFMPYIQFNEVAFFTDHKVLQHLENSKPLHGRLARIDSVLSALNKKVIHRPGSKMAHIDCISRFPTLTLPKENELEIEPDFVNPPLVAVPDIVTPSHVLAINSKTNGTSSKITAPHLSKLKRVSLILMRKSVTTYKNCNKVTLSVKIE